jgi:hypothetical protein
MKRILLRSAADKKTPQDVLEWRELIRQVIRRPLDTQRGADIEEMRKGIRVLDALDGCPETYGLQPEILALEDADWEHLKAKTLAMQWAIVDRRVLEFIDAILQASEQLSLNDEVLGAILSTPPPTPTSPPSPAPTPTPSSSSPSPSPSVLEPARS